MATAAPEYNNDSSFHSKKKRRKEIVAWHDNEERFSKCALYSEGEKR